MPFTFLGFLSGPGSPRFRSKSRSAGRPGRKPRLLLARRGPRLCGNQISGAPPRRRPRNSSAMACVHAIVEGSILGVCSMA